MTLDFQVVPHIRFNNGGAPISPALQPESQSVRLVRLGGSVHIYRVNTNGNLEFMQSEVIQFVEEPLLVGLAATGNGDFELYEFSNVSIEELPFNVMRSLSLPPDEFEPGISFSVTITATVRDGETVDAVVNEVPPRGSQISNVAATAGEVTTNDDGTINWGLSGVRGEVTLTYEITLPNLPSVSFQGTFNDGINLESYIGGPSVLPVDPQFPPLDAPDEFVDVDPTFPYPNSCEGRNIRIL